MRHILKTLGCISIVLLASKTSWATPTPLRVVVVTTPTELTSALTQAVPGDWIELSSGTYTGAFVATHAGTESNPIVITTQPGAHAIVSGSLGVQAAVGDVWLWGLEVTGNDDTGAPGIQIQGPRTKIINCYIHDVTQTPSNNQGARNGIAAWEQNGGGAGQEIYGNVIVRAHHNIYTQNDFDKDGYKKFIQNILDEDVGRLDGSNKFVMHCYTEGGVASGCDWEEGIAISGGTFLMGSTNNTTRHSVIKDSVFYKSTPQIQYSTPAQVDEFSGNKLYKTAVEIDYQLAPINIHHNAFYQGIANLRPSDATMTTRLFDSTDVFDWNVYQADTPSSSIHSSWWLFNKHQDCCGQDGLTQFRSDTAATGCPTCEAHGSTVTAPPTVDATVFTNAYEPGRGEMAIYNHAATGMNTVQVPATEFSKAVAIGAHYVIVRAVDGAWSPVVASGTFDGASVDVPVNGEFDAFLILPSTGASDSDAGAPLASDAGSDASPGTNPETPTNAAGCACSATGSTRGASGLFVGAWVLLLAARRRTRRA